MVTKDDWNNVYFSTMAMASVAVGALGVVLGVLALQRSQAAAGLGSLEPPPDYAPLGVNIPRVHYDDGRVLVEVRNPSEWHDIRDFVQPTNPEVTRIIREIFYG